MNSDSDIIYDSEPDRLVTAERSSRPRPDKTSSRNHLRRTSDERPGVNSEGSTAELERNRGRRKQKVEKAQEVLVLDSASEEEKEQASAKATTSSKYFRDITASPKRRRTRSPVLPVDPEGWPFSGEVRIGSRSPPLVSRRTSSRSLSTSFSAGASSDLESIPLPPIASTSRIPKESSPFTSALDLLHSRPLPPENDVVSKDSSRKSSRSKSNISTTSSRPKSRSSTSKTLALKQKGSTSSIEIVEDPSVRERTETRKNKSRSLDKDVDDEMSEDVTPPESWAEQFSLKESKRGSKSSTTSSSKGKGKAKEEVPQSQDGKRRKPWELLEEKIASSGGVKKRSTVRKKKAAPEKKEEEDSDDDDLQVLTSGSKSSTALKPCPSGRLSHFAAPTSSVFIKKKATSTSTKTNESDSKDSTLFDLPPPFVLPSDDRLKCLSHCPLCAFASTHSRSHTSVDSWGSKALSTRQNHLRLCAKSHDYSSQTVSHLVNQQILVLSVESEEKRLERDLEKSLFDRAIGKGEGTSGREVTVVGIENDGLREGDKEWFRDVKEVQEEVDGWRKKSKKGGIEERLARVAKEIKKELEVAQKLEVEGAETEREAGDKQEQDDFPRATGRLRPETEDDRDAVAKRAKELLNLANGTQLTRKTTVLVIDEETSMDISKGAEEQDLFLEPPRSTQTFEDSTLAKRCQHDGAINIVRPLASSPATKRRSRSPLHELDLAFSSDDEVSIPRSSSLWKANAGNDQDSLSRIVHSHSAPFGSPISPTRRISSPFIASPTSALNPHLSSLTLSSTSSPSASSSSSLSSLPDPATLMPRFVSSRNLVTSSRNRSLSPTRRMSRRQHDTSILLDEQERENEPIERARGSGESREGGERGGREELEIEWMDEGEEGLDLGGVMLIGGAGDTRNGGIRELGGGGAESSEEESLAQLVARTPSRINRKKKSKSKSPTPTVTATKKKPTRRRISPSSPSASNSDSNLPSTTQATADGMKSGNPPWMPNYSSLPLATLHKEVQKYGYRPSKEKSVVVQQLEDVWNAINKDKVQAWERGEIDDTGKKIRGKGKKKVVAIEGEEGVEVQKKAATKGRRKRRVIADESGAEEAEEGETRTVGERLRELIVNDEKLYLRILRYEPIHLDEFVLLAANNGVKVARTLLIRCLDEQSITFYQEDPTNGQRKRHK